MHFSETFHLQQHLIEVSRRYVNIYEVVEPLGGWGILLNFMSIYPFGKFDGRASEKTTTSNILSFGGIPIVELSTGR
jgi:hypothetical protein